MFLIIYVVILSILCILMVYTVSSGGIEINLSPEDTIKNEAKRIHSGQKYDNHPYTFHLDMVAKNVLKYVDYYIESEETEQLTIRMLWMAAQFHDSLEDCPDYNYTKLLNFSKFVFPEDKKFGETVAEIVFACTNEKGRTRKERQNFRYYKGIRETKYAPFIKACDRLANIEYSKKTGSKLFWMYQRELKDFLDSIYSEDNQIPPRLYQDLCQYLPD